MTASTVDLLTPRQREVYEFSLQGLTIHEIAGRLFIEPQTVKAYRWEIRQLGLYVPRSRHPGLVPPDGEYLAPRQRQVCNLIRRGCTYTEVSQRLGISWGTVKNHLSQARERWSDQQDARAAS